MMCRLDEETEYMMYEPGERQKRTQTLDRLKSTIESAVSGDDLLLVAEDADDIIGYLWAERGKLNRIRHTAYIVTGIRQAYQRRGIGTELFRWSGRWAKGNGILRLELTVECDNAGAKRLYENQGFRVEGVRKKSMKVGDGFVDEYYMAKILEQ